MIPQATAREALFAETLGDMAALVGRVDALLPVLQDTRQSLIDANLQLSKQLRDFEEQMTAITEKAKVVTVEHIAKHTNERTLKTMHVLALEIQAAARTALGTEIRPTLQGLMAPLQKLAHLAHQRENPWAHWERWLIHVATAAVASAVSWLAAAWLWIR
jgi:hypothetical protein